jgi:hypothetical protein
MAGWHRVSEWRAAPRNDWHITGEHRSIKMEGVDKEGSCSVTPVIKVKVPRPILGGEKTYSAKAKGRSVRCDTSPLIGWYPGGGCVIESGVLALYMSEDDEAYNAKNNRRTPFPEVYRHIKNALQHPTLTKPGRKTFYDLDPSSKDIPGNWGDWLSRAKYGADIGGSRGIVEVACNLEFTAAQRQGKQCDEFPFASTRQGARYAKPANNFSILPVDPGQNRAHGNVIGAWYQNNRVIRRDRFYIHLFD